MMTNMKQNWQKKIGSILSTFVLVISIILCLTVVMQVITNGYVQIGGISLFKIITGSMEPEVPEGSLIICQEVDISTVQVDDIVCFRSLDNVIYGETVTHRVVEVLQNSLGETILVTKGDANLSADAEYVTQGNYIGKVTYYSKESNLMASIMNILTDKVGFMILVLVPTLLIAGFILRSCMSNIRRELERLKAEEKKNENPLYSEEEYAKMLERIRDELIEEINDDVEEPFTEGKENSKTE